MAFGDHAEDARAPACVALWAALLAAGAQILVAAPTISELTRSDKKTTLPRTRNVQVVAFDITAAEILAEKLPEKILRALSKSCNGPVDYIKYDALIVSCAARHKAHIVITYDDAMAKMSKIVGVAAGNPEDFLDTQTDIFDSLDTVGPTAR